MTVRLRVKVTPRARTDAIDGWSDDGTLKVRVRSAPSNGRANEAVVQVLARAVGVAASSVRISAGASSRVKLIDIDAPAGQVAERLPATSQALPPGSAAR